MSNQQPPPVEWPSEWETETDPPWLASLSNAIYDECKYLCQRGWLPAPDGTASKCPPPVVFRLMANCEFHCEDGLLVDDGEIDECDGLLLLIPISYLLCPSCNPESWLNGDIHV